jgi:hypoxanthine phosphoribosyltransferase
MNEAKIELKSWDIIHWALIHLADRIRESNFNPEIIVGVSRGGWIPARILSDLLDEPTLANIRVEFYSGIYETMKKPSITQPVSLPVIDKRILIVDDIVDSGESLRLVCDVLRREGGEGLSATLYHKPWSCFKPDYYFEDVDSWVIFPWELYEMVKTLGAEMLEGGRSVKYAEEKLTGIGMDGCMVKKFLQLIFRGAGHEDMEL